MEFKANDLQNGYGDEGGHRKKLKEYCLISHYAEIRAFYQRTTSIFFFEKNRLVIHPARKSLYDILTFQMF